MFRPGYFFTQTNNGAIGGLVGSDQLKPVFNEATTAIVRSTALFCPCYSLICVDFAPGTTGSVRVINNPFDNTPSAKDKVLVTLTASGQFVMASAGIILVDVTAINGTISARVVFDQALDD
ncbi:hypothetical protein UFOVP1516_65 [uncultured Caudovirales phage]|uniref:Uncharacterized protein n=1 Tax=uncultured Caudovirales phage TaxID=2100421 RepID=A0A6J5PCS0_9CAUD|nr:hypothetical protein UFOVP887_70 [uncultured Caudovirales phage]CAB5226937.1 hypothetical protein UFOVP1516_65 [uncultured Caudovirales phage]